MNNEDTKATACPYEIKRADTKTVEYCVLEGTTASVTSQYPRTLIVSGRVYSRGETTEGGWVIYREMP